MSHTITRASVAVSPNLVDDLEALSTSLNGFLDVADRGADDPGKLAARFQDLKNVWGCLVGLYGANLEG